MPAESPARPDQCQTAVQAPSRRRLRFAISLRTLMLLVLLIGGWLGWFVYRAQVQRDAVDAVKKAQGFVIYDLDLTNLGPNPSPDSWVPEWLGGGKSWAPKWLIDRVGLDYFGTVIEATLRPSRVNDPARLDATLALVRRFGKLRELHLNGTAVTDAALANVEKMTSLRHLDLGNTPITDAGLAHVRGLAGLRELGFANTQVTDAGLAHLRGLPQLRSLSFYGTAVTDDAILELEEDLPSLQINREEEMAFGATQARAIRDLAFARSQPIRLTCLLLAHRAVGMANHGNKAELIATINALCELEPSDNVGRLRLACACAACVRGLDGPGVRGLPDVERQAIQQRCADRALAILSLAIDHGVKNVLHLDQDPSRLKRPDRFSAQLEPLGRYPGYLELVDKLKAARSGG